MPADLGTYRDKAPPRCPLQSLITIDLPEKPTTTTTVGVSVELAAKQTGMSNGQEDRARTAKTYLPTAQAPPDSSPVPLPGTADPARGNPVHNHREPKTWHGPTDRYAQCRPGVIGLHGAKQDDQIAYERPVVPKVGRCHAGWLCLTVHIPACRINGVPSTG